MASLNYSTPSQAIQKMLMSSDLPVSGNCLLIADERNWFISHFLQRDLPTNRLELG